MGFIKAFTGALGASFADQWKDFYKPMDDVPATAAIFPAIQEGSANGRGENTKGSEHIISNGSKILVQEGTALITMQDGAITGCITEPGGFIFNSEDTNSQSFLGGDGFFASTLGRAVDNFKFGGRVSSEQKVVYVNLRPIPNNPFGTQSTIYWDDAYLGVQAGAMVRGTYTIQIVDPTLFIKNLNVTKYIEEGKVLDLGDEYDSISEQLFQDVAFCLGAAFATYANDPEHQNRMAKIQSDTIGFAKVLSETVEAQKQWKSLYGIEIVSANIMPPEYDENTKKLLEEMNRLDALNTRNRGNQNVQQGVAKALEGLGDAGGMNTMTGLAFMGMGNGNLGGIIGSVQQPVEEKKEDPMEKLKKLKEMLDMGLITQEDYDEQKRKLLEVL